MTLRNAFESIATEATLAAASAKLSNGNQFSMITGSPAQAAVGIKTKINPFGSMQTLGAVTKVVSDSFDAPLDVINTWNATGTNPPTTTSNKLTLSLAGTNSLSSVLTSQESFVPALQPFVLSTQLELGAAQTNPNVHRFWGKGVVTSYAASTPLTNGFGWEVDITGALNAVVYKNGTRYVVNSTNPALITASGGWDTDMVMSTYGTTISWPASGTANVTMMYYNGYVFFYISGSSSGSDVPVGFIVWVPGQVKLPLRVASITTPASTVLATTFNMSTVIMGTINGTNMQLADPTYAWRQAAVTIGKPITGDGGLVVHQAPSDIFRSSFADSYTGIVAPEFLLLKTGTGMAVNQTGGNLVITSGTTASSETLIRSLKFFRGALSIRFKQMLSQRIANNNFIIELADLVGENLAYSITNATTVVVTFLQVNPFTTASVGQSVNLGVITGAAGIPGRFVIASVSGLTVTFTVVAWPATGTGTLTLFGWNFIKTTYTGTTATNAAFDTARRGWASGDSTLTTLTSAAPGYIATMQSDNAFVDWSDSLVASAAAPAFVSRGSRLENIPDDNINLYLFIRVMNGTSAPATTTTWTVGLVQIEQTGNNKVYVAGAQNNAANRGVSVLVGNTVPVSGTLTANIGTGSLAAGTNAIGDTGTQYRANATGAASVSSVISPATPAVATIKASAGRLIGWQLHNSSAAVRSVKVFNATAPTLGTTSAVFEIDIPAGGMSEQSFDGGIGFSTAMTWSVTSVKGLTDNASTGLASGDVSGSFVYA